MWICMFRRFRHNIVILLLGIVTFVLCTISGCVHSVDSRLKTAEYLMEEHPDSALSILSSIDVDKFPHLEDLALYGLLYTQALDKNHLDPTDDSIISRSVEFYGERGDKDYLLKSTYFLGRTQFIKRHYSSAIVNFYKALRLAEDIGDDYWAGMSCRGISDIYHKTFNTSDDVNFAKKELDFLQKAGRQPYLNYALCDLGISLYSNGQIDSVFVVCQQIADSAKKYEDTYLSNEANKLRGLGLFSKGQYDEACEVFHEVCQTPYAGRRDSLLLGLSLCGINRLDEAEIIASSMQDNCQPLKNSLLYNIYEKKGDYKNALKEWIYVDSISDVTLQEGINHNISTSLSDYYEFDRHLAVSKLKASRSVFFAVLSFVLLIMVFLVFIVVHFKKKHNMEMEEKIRFADDLRNSLYEYQKANEKNHEILKKTLTDNLEIIDDFSNIIIQNPDSKNLRKKTADAVSRLIEELSTRGDKVQMLERKVDMAYDNLFTDFKEDLPGLKDVDYLLYLFSILEFSNMSISVILKEDKIEAIYNRKRRLKDRIKLLEESKRIRYLEYL